MILDPACKRVQCLFKSQHLFPNVHLSRVEWQVLVPVFISLITWLEANTLIKVHELRSVTDKMHKCILQDDNERDEYAVNNRLYQHPKGGCTHHGRYQE